MILIFQCSFLNYNPEIMWSLQSTQKAVINRSIIAHPTTVFIRKLPTSLHDRSVYKSGDEKLFTPLFADISLDLQVIVLKVLAVPVELKSAHPTVFP